MLKSTGHQMDALTFSTRKEAKHHRYGRWLCRHDAIVSGAFSRPDQRKLTGTIEGLERIDSDDEFNKMHRVFCQWFVKTIGLAKTEEPSSYGHAAKVLDLALKVYVYYCKMPSLAKAELLTPRLNGSLTRQSFAICQETGGHLRESVSAHYLWTIKMINAEDYDLLQKALRQESETPLMIGYHLFSMMILWGNF